MDFVGLDKMSLLDFEDYVSTVLFSKHCNFRCPFCHNGLTVLDSEETIPFEVVLKYLSIRKGMVDAVVISGGEPTLMPDLKEKITVIKAMGFLVKLDTNGTHPEVLKDLIDSKLIDYVAMDIKNSPSKYAITSGVINPFIEEIKQSIEILKCSNIPFEFRTTLVNEFHDEESIKEMGEFIKGSPKLFLQKFVEREGCIKKGLHEVSIDQANKFKEILSNYVKEVNLRGY